MDIYIIRGARAEASRLRPGSSILHELIKNKPMHVECFAPCPYNHILTPENAQKAISGLSSELLRLSGELADLPAAADLESAVVGPILSDEASAEGLDRLRASSVSESGALRVAARALRDTGEHLPRL